MKLRVLGSGSSGNCYILENEAEALIIEAGVPFMEVKKIKTAAGKTPPSPLLLFRLQERNVTL